MKKKFRNALNHRLIINSKILEPGEVVELEVDDVVKHCVEQGLLVEVEESEQKVEEKAAEEPEQKTEEKPRKKK